MKGENHHTNQSQGVIIVINFKHLSFVCSKAYLQDKIIKVITTVQKKVLKIFLEMIKTFLFRYYVSTMPWIWEEYKKRMKQEKVAKN